MTDQLLAELRKMRSTRTNLGLLGGMVGLILLTVLLNGFIPKPHELATYDNQYMLLSAGTSAALFAALIGVMAITSEFRHGTIRPTFVVTPHRIRVVAAKVTASLLMGALFGLAAIGLSFGVGSAILSVRDIPLELGTSDVLWLVLGTPAMTAAWAAIGVGLGAVVRNQVFAVIGLIVWAMVIDNLLRALVPSIGGYTPVGASAALVADPADYVLAAAAGGLLLLGYVAGIRPRRLAARRAPRRDVTAVLSVVDIRKRFGEVQALDGCSLSVARGRMLGFLGPERGRARRPSCAPSSASSSPTAARCSGTGGRSGWRNGCASATCRRSVASIRGCRSEISLPTSGRCTG